MTSVDLVDRSAMVKRMNSALRINPKTTAIVTIDMHRGHLDPAVATSPCTPEDCDRVIRYTRELLGIARQYKIPVIHVILIMRQILGMGSELLAIPFIRCQQMSGLRPTAGEHNIEGRVQTQIIPELYQPGDYVINNKKRLDCFYGTDLESLLRALGVDTTVFVGVNTNTCVLGTCFTAYNKCFKAIVISDCVASRYGPDLHIFGLETICATLGWVLTVREFEQKLSEVKTESGSTKKIRR